MLNTYNTHWRQGSEHLALRRFYLIWFKEFDFKSLISLLLLLRLRPDITVMVDWALKFNHLFFSLLLFTACMRYYRDGWILLYVGIRRFARSVTVNLSSGFAHSFTIVLVGVSVVRALGIFKDLIGEYKHIIEYTSLRATYTHAHERTHACMHNWTKLR